MTEFDPLLLWKTNFSLYYCF